MDLQKEISVIWPNLSQKALDLLVPIHKGEIIEQACSMDNVFQNISWLDFCIFEGYSTYGCKSDEFAVF